MTYITYAHKPSTFDNPAQHLLIFNFRHKSLMSEEGDLVAAMSRLTCEMRDGDRFDVKACVESLASYVTAALTVAVPVSNSNVDFMKATLDILKAHGRLGLEKDANALCKCLVRCADAFGKRVSCEKYVVKALEIVEVRKG